MHKIDLRHVDLNLLVAFDVLMEERNVTLAAKRLARTQSAVSHALARLREQLGDPLLVKVAGGMRASPYAEDLVCRVRPILAELRRALAPVQPFDPATSTRRFHIAIADNVPSLFADLHARFERVAPRVDIEWSTEEPDTPQRIAEGSLDIAFVACALSLPLGVASGGRRDLEWATYVRRGHPAIKDWGIAAWQRWPHVIVGIGNRLQNPVSEATRRKARGRRIGARVTNFTSVAPLLAHTDLLATLPLLTMADALARYDLVALPPPLAVPRMPHHFIWNASRANEPANRWLREQVLDVFAAIVERSGAR